MPKSFDVIIIGGGIMGCCSAFEIAKRGLKVALFDKNNIGQGPSGKSSAIIRQHYSNEITASMALYSLKVFQNFDEIVGGESGFTNTGFVALVESKDRAGLESNIALQHRIGINTEIITTADIREIMPGIEVDDLVAVAYEPDSGYADPYMTVNSYAKAAKRNGVVIHQDAEVTAINFHAGHVSGVSTNTETFDAPIVLNCGGAWGARVSKLAGVEVPIDSCRVQVAFFRRPKGHERAHPVVADFVNATYFRSETGGLTLVGVIDPSEAGAIVDPDHFKEYLDDEFILDSGERLINRYPAMEMSQSTGGYASLYAITPDWHPIIDEIPSNSGFYVCSGFSGHGFKLGPAVGLLVSEMISGISQPRFNHRVFRATRFAEGKQVRGQYEYSIVG